MEQVPTWERPTVDLRPPGDTEEEDTAVGPDPTWSGSRLVRALGHVAGAAIDSKRLAALQARIPLFEAACRRAGLDSKNARLQAAFFDLSNQCASRIWSRFLTRMPVTLTRKQPTLKDVVHARFDALFDDRGRFIAGSLSTAAGAISNQLKRQLALEAELAQGT